jgi:hypothetical protein
MLTVIVHMQYLLCLWFQWIRSLGSVSSVRILLEISWRHFDAVKLDKIIHVYCNEEGYTPQPGQRSVQFIMLLSTQALSHRKPASIGTFSDNCHTQGHDKRDIFVLRWDIFVCIEKRSENMKPQNTRFYWRVRARVARIWCQRRSVWSDNNVNILKPKKGKSELSL